MKNEIIKLESPELLAIEKSKAEQIKATFEPMVAMLSEFETQFTEVVTESETGITKEITIKAKRLRIDIGKVRIETEKLRVAQKEEYLRAGKAIDGVSNILKWAVTDKENKLKEIEDHFEIQEQKRLEALQSERVGLLLPYVSDAHERKLSEMEADVWTAYFEAKKKAYEDEQAAIKQAELDRIAKEKAEFEENERIRKENELLKIAAEKKAKQDEAEQKTREKAEAERLEKERIEREKQAELQRKEREAYEAKIRAEQEAKEKELAIERAKQAKLEAELKAKQEAEQKAIIEAQRKEKEAEVIKQAELNKGDSDKVKDLVNDLTALKTKYQFKSAKNQKMFCDVGILIDKVVNHIGAN